jgi:Mg-chelatase subunit ChlD
MRFAFPLALLLIIVLIPVLGMGWPARGSMYRREILSLVLRVGIILCLIFSLAGMEIVRAGRELAVIFLVDVSDSMPEAAIQDAMQFVRDATAEMPQDGSAQAGVIVFGGEALVERPLSASPVIRPITSIPRTNLTDIGKAIHLGLALYPSGSARRMVILSDGLDTSSIEDSASFQEAARLAAGSGVELIMRPFVVDPGLEVLVSDVSAPSQIRQGERFDLSISLEATGPVETSVRVLAGERVIYETRYALERGRQSFNLPLTAEEPGFTSYQVQIEPEEDGFYQNNQAAAYTYVTGPPHLLLVAPEPGERIGNQRERPDEYTALMRALEAGEFRVDAVPPGALPANLVELANYEALILVDVPARQLTQRQMQAVQSYVRDLGGGLVAVGGPTSYGVGGWYQTPLEETLPVEMQIKDEQRRSSVAMVFIIDRSGSMSSTSGGVSKLDLAKEAAARSVELLSPLDRVGVITFDSAAAWTVPMTDLSNPGEVINAIGSIRAGGGTDILAGLRAMAETLPNEPSSVKHVILLTDGGANPQGIPELVSSMQLQYNITLTAVGVGSDAAPFLEQIAELGGGRYHFTAEPASIPSIFTEETTLATRAYIVEGTFYPQLETPSQILTGIREIPPLHGYVSASSKAAAQTILVSEQGDPILAAWQYGLGRAVAFTSDASGAWGKDWVGWEQFPNFWSQAAGFSSRQVAQSGLQVRVVDQGKQARLEVDAYNLSGSSLNGPQGTYLNDYQMEANLVGPTGEVSQFTLSQTAPGRYEGSFNPSEQGAYLIRISAESPEGDMTLTETAGWVLSYSPEYSRLGSDPDQLLRVAAQVGGKVASANPGDVFTQDLPAPARSRPAWPWLLALATLALPLDIAARRLLLTKADLSRAGQKARSFLPSMKRPRLQAGERGKAGRSAQVEPLLKVKETIQQRSGNFEKLLDIQEKDDPGNAAQPTLPTPEREIKMGEPKTSTAASLLVHKRNRQKRESGEIEGDEPDS